MLRRKEPLLIGILLLLSLPYGYDFSHELFENEHDLTYLLVESLSVTLASLGILFLFGEIRQQQRATSELQAQLGRTRADLLMAHTNLHQLNQKVQQASRQYGLVIQEQLTTWGLSPSEKEVALLLLKGLSFEEIAQARGTRSLSRPGTAINCTPGAMIKRS